MAIPFGDNDDQGKQNETAKRNGNEDFKTNLRKVFPIDGKPNEEARDVTDSSTNFNKPKLNKRHNHQKDEKGAKSANVYFISNSSHLNCGPVIINVTNKKSDSNRTKALSPSAQTVGQPRAIRVRKGIFESKRLITSKDIEIVSQDVEKDWRILVQKLPGINSYSSTFHQTLIDALESKDAINLAEVAFSKWKDLFPEISTVGNLAKILFSMDHPDIVTKLKP